MEENPVLNKPDRSVFTKIIRMIFGIILLIIVFALSLIALLFVYEDEVKAAIVSELNKHLKAEVKIDPKNIDLTIIKTFPDCSIEFKDLLMLEALPLKNRDTLLFAGQLNLHFNIKDLWNKKYEIEKVKLRNATAKLRVFKDGKTNYMFWESTSVKPGQKQDSIYFNLKLISVENCRLSYKNKKSLFKTTLNIRELEFSGRFRDHEYEMRSKAGLSIDELVQGKTPYLKNKQLNFAIDLDVDEDSYTLKKAKINLNKLGLELSGKFTFKDSLEMLDLKYQAPDLDISSLLSLLPEKFKEKISDYESSGNFYAGGTIRYLKRSFSVVTDFGIKQGKITYKPGSTTATNVNLDGYLNYSNSASVLNLKNIHLNLNTDEIKGSCLINDFNNPYLLLRAKANVGLGNIQNFWPIDTLKSLKGQLEINTEVEGLLSLLKGQTFSDKVKINLDAKVSGLEAQFKNDEKTYTVEHCIVTAKDRHAEVKDLKLKRGSSDLTLNGKIPGLFNYIVDRKAPLTITGSLFSNALKMEDFIDGSKSSSEGNDDPLIPPNMNFKLNAAMLKFSFGKFNAQAITGEIEIRNQKAIVSDMKLQTMQGEAVIDAFADNSKNRLDVTLQSNLKNINIGDLFSDLNNFGQATLTNENLKGQVSANIEFIGSWSNKLVSDLRSIRSTCSLSIQNGELNDFKPLLSLAKFVDVEELKRIKFSSLQSAIEIKNNTIIIPRTNIKNSLLDVEVWGTHTFENRIDYHIQLIISRLLAKKRQDKDSQFGVVENDPEDRRSAFIAMKGTLDNPEIKYLDGKGMKEKIRSDMKQAGKDFKRVLKEDWNLFKKDTSLKKTNKEETHFELEKPEQERPKKTLEPKKKEEEEDF